jgi:hypothetical protein
MASNLEMQGKLLHELMDFAELRCADEHHLGYCIYHIEFPKKGIGFSISAKKVDSDAIAEPYWVIRDFSTFNV